MGSTTPLLDILSAHLPAAISSELSSLTSPQSRSTVDILLSFALGGDCPTRLHDVHQEWSRNQPAALAALQDGLKIKGGTKRTRDSQDTDDATSKRQKTWEDDTNDPPLFTLPSISTASPIRKKVDVTVHARSIRFTNPSTCALESSVPIASIARAFLLPTRGRSKGHWTVVLLPTDAPDKAKASPASAQQIIFGLDARSATTFETTSYLNPSGPTTSNSTTTVAKGEETATSVRQFLSHIPVPLLEPSATVFRSACATAKAGEGAAGIDAHLSTKSGTLWFFDTGILWGEGKPCEFWPVSELASKDGVRMISATGRTCSVILSRKSGASANGSGGTAEDDSDGVVETEFSMVNGREQDPIHAWARNRKHLFGKTPVVPAASGSSSYVKSSNSSSSGGGGGGNEARPSQQQQSNGTVKGPAWDDSDSDDEDFEATSSEDLEQSSSDSDGSEDANEGVNDSDSAEESGDESGEEEELQQAHHRPGAMPRMSKAVTNTVIDLVHDDVSEEEDELEE